jgi:8-oxo-dGTP pyrophosphatase MutT (NUDIX family)
MLKVVAGFLFDYDTFLIGQRKSDNNSYPDYWELPGGKVDDSDLNTDESIKREWREELDIEVFIWHELPTRIINDIEVIPYMLKYESGKPTLNEHKSVKFVKFKEIKHYKLTPISKEILHIIKRSYNIFLKPQE